MSARKAGPTQSPTLSWSELLSAYRHAPTTEFSSVLVERLGPWLTNARKTLLAAPPFADAEDVAQQLVVEVLRLAARWKPGCEDRWIPRRLVEAATRRVRRSLRREHQHPTLELDSTVPASDPAPADLLLDTPMGRATAADLRLLYRYAVVG